MVQTNNWILSTNDSIMNVAMGQGQAPRPQPE